MYADINKVKSIANINIADSMISEYLIIAENQFSHLTKEKDTAGISPDLLASAEALLCVSEIISALTFSTSEDRITNSLFAGEDTSKSIDYQSLSADFYNKAQKIINTFPDIEEKKERITYIDIYN